MTTIAIMTMLFLPGTFLATVFAIPLLKWDTSPVIQHKFWLYWALTLPSTLIVFILWYMITKRKEANKRLENQQQRDSVGKMASMITNSLSQMTSLDSGSTANAYLRSRKRWLQEV
jgi:membrane protein implicated in regulation of membrane protease activity